MKKVIIFILIFLFVFAFIRITTSTYENLKRGQNPQVAPTTKEITMMELFRMKDMK